MIIYGKIKNEFKRKKRLLRKDLVVAIIRKDKKKTVKIGFEKNNLCDLIFQFIRKRLNSHCYY